MPEWVGGVNRGGRGGGVQTLTYRNNDCNPRPHVPGPTAGLFCRFSLRRRVLSAIFLAPAWPDAGAGEGCRPRGDRTRPTALHPPTHRRLPHRCPSLLVGGSARLLVLRQPSLSAREWVVAA